MVLVIFDHLLDKNRVLKCGRRRRLDCWLVKDRGVWKRKVYLNMLGNFESCGSRSQDSTRCPELVRGFIESDFNILTMPRPVKMESKSTR